MKKIIMAAAVALTVLLSTAGCERGLTERERECMELTGDSSCISEIRHSERGMSGGYGPAAPGEYTNYYGSPEHGSWDSSGRYNFHNPNSSFASSTNAFLLGAGMGGLAAYALTKNANRSSWNKANPGGYKPTTRTNTKYIGKGGKEISKSEYQKRKAQSKADKKKAAKAKKLKQKQAANAKKAKKQKARIAEQKRATAKKQQRNAGKKPLSFDKKNSTYKQKPRKSKPRKSTKRRK